MSRIGSAFAVLGDVIWTFIFSFLTSKLEKLPDMALFQRYRVRKIFKPIRGKKSCICTYKYVCVCKCVVYCVPKKFVKMEIFFPTQELWFW